MSLWYYAKHNQQLGPIQFTALRQLAAEGVLAPDDLVWHDNLPNWQPAGEIDGLFPAASAPIGYQSPAPYGQAIGPSQQGMAITALVLGCVSFVFGGPLLGIPALICGKIALRRMGETRNYEGKGMAQAGVIIGYIWCALTAVIIVILMLLFFVVMAVHH
jgi:hypothetical protein